MEVETHRFISEENREGDVDRALRPSSFSDFPGQDRVKRKLQVYVEASRKRNESLDHILLCGPPGLGKTTLASIVANSIGVTFRSTSGPAIDKKGDLAALLTSLPANSVLFIDEIHRLNRTIEEYLYSAMEDYSIDIVAGEGMGANVMKFQLAPFTLIGATTRSGLLNAPFRDRFGIVERLQFYKPEDLNQIVQRSSKLLETQLDDNAGLEIARRSRGTPRIANRLLKRVRDFAEVKDSKTIDLEITKFALEELEVDHAGLDAMDRQILFVMKESYAGGPVGIETLSAALSEDKETLEDVYEPYLIQMGFIQKTPRGRQLTQKALSHLDGFEFTPLRGRS